MAYQSRTTTNHEVIQLWTEDRGGSPASVAETHSEKDVGLLRIYFAGHGSGEALDEISWDDFFEKFEEAKLAFIYETKTEDGSLSRFSKLVSR